MGTRVYSHGGVMFFLTVLFLSVSCSPPSEKAHPLFIKAENLFKDRDYPGAEAAYQKYLDFNRQSPLTHEKLAGLYRNHLDDPFLAAYHYRRYLVYMPDSTDREAIEAWITAAEKDFALKTQKRYPEDFISLEYVSKLEDDKRRLVEYALRIKDQNAQLLKQVKADASARPAPKTEVVPDGIQELYTVKHGDSLQKISRDFYGTSAHYKFIYEANTDVLKSESRLSIGQTLKIPKLSEASSEAESGSPPGRDAATPDDDYPGIIIE
ncbi:MAG: LysM peptidoglycan-binding domain-containing protein [Victivallales bacterium]|nr:LysM peptidoglycan-binding domain-containing protein [Victivallales bacterium]